MPQCLLRDAVNDCAAFQRIVPRPERLAPYTECSWPGEGNTQDLVTRPAAESVPASSLAPILPARPDARARPKLGASPADYGECPGERDRAR